MSWQTPENLSADETPVNKTASFSVAAGERYIRCSHASTPIVATLPAASGSGRSIRLLNLGAALTSVIRAGSDLIGGADTLWLPQYASCVLVDAASAVWDIAAFDCPSIPRAHFTLNANLTGLSGSYAINVITFDTTVANYGGGLSLSAGLATCILPGTWRVTARLFCPTNTDVGYALQKNSTGGFDIAGWASARANSYLQLNAVVNLAVGDTVRVTSNAYLSHAINTAGTWLQMEWEGR